MDVQAPDDDFSDEQWLKALRESGLSSADMERAWEVLHRHYYRTLWSAVNQMLQDEALTEDVVQEAFVKAYRSFERFKGESKVGTWLYRIAMNQAYDALRKRNRRQKWLGLFPLQEDEESQPHEAVDEHTAVVEAEGRDRQELIREALEKLSPEHRAVVELRLVQGFSTEETARILKLQKGTVLSRLFYSCQKLKKHLKQSHEELGNL
ncbi:MAG: sigma-70 family RNA polymerase sigma factor [Blastochloris sp.]|nr:sigma-70 family RNA polymerase sigma factor [Blastochloris sp.]